MGQRRLTQISPALLRPRICHSRPICKPELWDPLVLLTYRGTTKYQAAYRTSHQEITKKNTTIPADGRKLKCQDLHFSSKNVRGIAETANFRWKIKPPPGNSHKIPEIRKTFICLPKEDGGNSNRDFTRYNSWLPLSSLVSQEKNNNFSSILITFGFLFKLCDAFERNKSDYDTGILKGGI